MNEPVTIGIVAARFNQTYVDGLVASARKVLADTRVIEIRVPGSYEIPLGVARLLRREDVAAVLAFGVIWEGKTAHADIIARDVSRALMELMLQHDKPVIQQVLTVRNERQARARCFGKKLNRGTEGAHAVLDMLQLDFS